MAFVLDNTVPGRCKSHNTLIKKLLSEALFVRISLYFSIHFLCWSFLIFFFTKCHPIPMKPKKFKMLHFSKRPRELIKHSKLFISLSCWSCFSSFCFYIIPGTPEERGIRKMNRGNSASKRERMESYDLPFGMDFLRRHRIFKYIPISPTFSGYQWSIFTRGCHDRREDEMPTKPELGESGV